MVEETIGSSGGIEAYLQAQAPEHADICRRLVAEIQRCLPKSTARLYHGSPAWFIVKAGPRGDLGFPRYSQRAPCIEFEDRVLTRRRNSDRSGRTRCAHSPATRSDR
jgi:hypothetical protein